MRIIKLKISNDIFEAFFGFNIFNEIEQIEVKVNFQYDEDSFFSLQEIIFKDFVGDDWEKVLRKYFKVEFLHVLHRTGNVVQCVLKIKTGGPIWKALKGNWAIIPPIKMTSQFVSVILILPLEYVELLYDLLNKNATSYEIASITSIDSNGFFEMDKSMNTRKNLELKITPRQKEVVNYAVKNGYYHSPKKITADEIGEKFNITVSAVNQLLRKVEHGVMNHYFS
jgi:predicted DNA binding protein